MILKKTSQREIKWCVPKWNADTQANNMLAQVLGQDAEAFAQCSVGNGYYQWYHKLNSLKPLSKFDEQVQVQAKLKIAELSAKLEDKIPGVAELIVKYPSDDYIFCSTEGGLHVVLAGWGFVSIGKPIPGPTIEDLPSPVIEHPVRIAFVKKGSPIPLRSFSIKNVHRENENKTDSEGYFCIGVSMKPGVEFTVIDQRTQKVFHVLVDHSQEDYLLDVTMEDGLVSRVTDYDITVVNQEGTLTPDYPLMVNNDSVTSGYDGVIRFSKVSFSETKNQIHVRNLDGVESVYSLSEDPGLNHFTFIWHQHFTSSLCVRVENEVGTGIPNYLLKISAEGGNKEYYSDNEGLVNLDDLTPGTDVIVVDGRDSDNYGEIHLERGANSLLLTIPTPKPKMVRIGLHDLDESPLVRVPVALITSVGSYTYTTDADGNLWIPFEYFANKGKVKFSFEYKGEKITKNVSM